MTIPEQDKQRKLDELAREDKIYFLWHKCYQEYAAQFEEFVKSQPEEISSFLWAYAEAGRMMYRRKLALACKFMDFTEAK